MAGLRNCGGEIVIILDDDFQNPPDEALKLAEYTLANNYDVVFTKYKIKNDCRKFNFCVSRVLLKSIQ